MIIYILNIVKLTIRLKGLQLSFDFLFLNFFKRDFVIGLY